jgi:hypothetical protein
MIRSDKDSWSAIQLLSDQTKAILNVLLCKSNCQFADVVASKNKRLKKHFYDRQKQKKTRLLDAMGA